MRKTNIIGKHGGNQKTMDTCPRTWVLEWMNEDKHEPESIDCKAWNGKHRNHGHVISTNDLY